MIKSANWQATRNHLVNENLREWQSSATQAWTPVAIVLSIGGKPEMLRDTKTPPWYRVSVFAIPTFRRFFRKTYLFWCCVYFCHFAAFRSTDVARYDTRMYSFSQSQCRYVFLSHWSAVVCRAASHLPKTENASFVLSRVRVCICDSVYFYCF